MREIYIKILRNTMLSHDYHIFRVNSKKNFSPRIDSILGLINSIMNV